jgi:hypothetical protein
MSTILRRIYVCLAVLSLLYGALFACSLHALGLPFWTAGQFLAAVAAAAMFFAASKWLKHSAALNCLALLTGLIFIELALQVVAWAGVLPAVNIKSHFPYARAYWTREGLGNAMRNRFGWYFPPFRSSAKWKIALVGDSMVEAVEIHPSRNQGVVLENLLRASGRDAGLFAFGNHGTSPAHARETIRYASRHFQPQEVILCITIANDISDGWPSLNGLPPSSFIYYDMDAENRLVLNPGSAGAQERFVQSLEAPHGPVWAWAGGTLASHMMGLQTLMSVRQGWAERHRGPAVAPLAAGTQDEIAQGLTGLGLKPRCFRLQPDAEVEKAMAVLLGTIRACQQDCAQRNVRFRLMTIPVFPKVFYDQQKGSDWTLRFGNYDFQAPEQHIGAFASSNGIPILELGRFMKEKHLSVEEIRKLYLSGGSGHLSEAGHRFCAEGLFESFYQPAAAGELRGADRPTPAR